MSSSWKSSVTIPLPLSSYSLTQNHFIKPSRITIGVPRHFQKPKPESRPPQISYHVQKLKPVFEQIIQADDSTDRVMRYLNGINQKPPHKTIRVLMLSWKDTEEGRFFPGIHGGPRNRFPTHLPIQNFLVENASQKDPGIS